MAQRAAEDILRGRALLIDAFVKIARFPCETSSENINHSISALHLFPPCENSSPTIYRKKKYPVNYRENVEF